MTRWLTCIVLGSIVGGWAQDARASDVLSAGIPPQPMADALDAFAHQTGLQIIYVSRIAETRTSKGARAGMTPAATLQALLDGTGLGFEYLNARTVRVFEMPLVQHPLSAVDPTRAPSVASRTAGSGESEEILVTGFRGLHAFGDAEDVQHVAASMSAVSGETLGAHNLGQLGDYAAYLVGLNIETGGVPGVEVLQLRGIGTITDSEIAYYIDDAPIRPTGVSRLAWPVPDLYPYDLQRLEVRRGPQGTQGGEGSEVGLIRYLLNPPNVSAFEATVGADMGATHYASRPAATVHGVVNVPIVKDVLAVRASGYNLYSPGFVDNVNVHAERTDVNVQRRYGGRITALWYPADSLTLKFTAFWNEIKADSSDLVLRTDPATAVDAGDANIYKGPRSWHRFTQDSAFLSSLKSSTNFYSATLSWNPGSIEIVSATSWSHDELHAVSDTTPGTGANFPLLGDGTIPAGLSNLQHNGDFDKFTEEIDVTSAQGESIEWLLGAFFTSERVTERLGEYAFDYGFRPIARLAPAIWLQVVPNTFQNWAVFGDLTWRITDKFDVTGGIRYDHYDEKISATVAGSAIDEPVAWSAQFSEHTMTWRATARYRFSPDVMLYGLVATGSQPGSSNDPGLPPVHADSLVSYEAGLKAGFLDGKGMIDLSVFHIDWRDIQLQNLDPNGWYFINGGRAVSRGVELTSSFSPVDKLQLGYKAVYTRAELTKLVPAGQYYMTGYQMPHVPKWEMSITADYGWSLTDAWKADVGGAYHWIGAQWSAIVQSRSHGGAPTMELPAYSMLDLNARIARGPLALEVFARNVADTKASRHGLLGVDASSPTAIAGTEDYMVQPRTIGVGVEYSF